MVITEVSVNLVNPKDGLIAFASIVIDDSIFLSSVAVHRRLNQTGFRLSYPTRKSDPINRPLFHPVNKEAGLQIEQAVTEKLNSLLEKVRKDGDKKQTDIWEPTRK